MKKCSRCRKTKKNSEFYSRGKTSEKRKSAAAKLDAYCKLCHKIKHKEYIAKNKQREKEYNRRQQNKGNISDWNYKRKYGISEQDYQDMLAAQNGRCKLCLCLPGKIRLDVDHDHETGRVRGIVCRRCNGMLGVIDSKRIPLSRIEDYYRD